MGSAGLAGGLRMEGSRWSENDSPEAGLSICLQTGHYRDLEDGFPQRLPHEASPGSSPWDPLMPCEARAALLP